MADITTMDPEALAEAARRGLLPDEVAKAYKEYQSRGLGGAPGAPGGPGTVPKPPQIPSAPGFSFKEQLEDAKRGLPRALEEGVIGLATGIPTMVQMGAALTRNFAKEHNIPGADAYANIVDKYGKFISPAGMLFDPRLNYGSVQPAIEKAYQQGTGQPLYEPHTPLGQAVRGGVSTGVGLLAGPSGESSFANRMLTGAGAALGATAGGYAAHEMLPESYQKVGGPIAEMAGALLGSKAGPRAVTPFPNRDPYHAAQAGLLEREGVGLSPARKTGNPWLAQREANLGPSARNAGELSDFSGATLSALGIDDTRATSQNLREAKDRIKTGYDSLVQNNTLMYQPNTLPGINQIGSNYKRVAGASAAPSVQQFVDRFNNGVSGKVNPNTQVMGMRGAHYQDLKEQLNNAIEGASTHTERSALLGIRDHLDSAWRESLPLDQRPVWDTLNHQYANWQLVGNAKLPTDKFIGPDDLAKAVAKQRGNKALNLEEGYLPALASAGQGVLTQLPRQTEGLGPLARGAGGLAGTLAGYRYSHEPVTAAIAGSVAASDAGNLVSGLMRSKPVASAYKAISPYLGNQALPPPNMGNPELLSRLLMSRVPQTQQQ